MKSSCAMTNIYKKNVVEHNTRGTNQKKKKNNNSVLKQLKATTSLAGVHALFEIFGTRARTRLLVNDTHTNTHTLEFNHEYTAHANTHTRIQL